MTMRNDAFASPLTVWVGPTRYVFGPGRDIVVGYGGRWDIPMYPPGNAPPAAAPTHPELVLRFAGTRWVAIDNSRNGFFVNGARVSTVDIRDGQAITIGDPHRGPRLVFQIGAPAGPPGPPPPGPPRQPPAPPPPPPPVARPPDEHEPTLRTTRRIPIPAPRPPSVQGPRLAPPPIAPPPPPPPLTEPAAALPPPPPPAAVEDQQPKGRGLIERMTDATRKLRAQRAPVPTGEPGPGEPVLTHRLPLKAGARTVGLTAYQLGLTVDEREVLTDVSFTARPGTLTAVTGPSAARNSVLLGLLAGTRDLDSGRITVDGHDIHAEPQAMRARIGIVPRDDRLHPQLTVQRALGYAAELRLPADASREHRQRVVDQVLEELELTPFRSTRISKLAPEFRRCAAMAVELLTRPTLLLVDEPGAGLDAAQESHVMAVLRRQADIGCVVVASVTSSTSLAHLNICDQVVVLTSRGTVAFAGAPLEIGPAMATTDWSEVLAQVSADPDGAHRAFRARQPAPDPPEVAEPWPTPAEPGLKGQFWLVAGRQARLFFADRLYLLFLAALPFALAGLTLLIPGDSGLSQPGSTSRNPHEAVEILAALNIAAVIIGIALTIRDLVGERRIFRREQAVGLSPTAYLTAKIVFFSVAAAALTAIAFTIVVGVKGRPVHGAVLLYDGTVELYVSVAVTAIVSAIIGLAVSTMGRSLRGVVGLAVPVILASLLFAGGLITLVGTWGYDQISWFIPAQWGFAASAATVDLRRVDALAANAQMWTHYVGWWMFDMMMLVLLGAVWAGVARYRLRRHSSAATNMPSR
jgi:ABC-type multidrug transport system ATPase subunit